MKEPETVNQFMTQLTSLVNQLIVYGEDIADQRVIEKVLKSLQLLFELAVAVIVEEAKDTNQMQVYELTVLWFLINPG